MSRCQTVREVFLKMSPTASALDSPGAGEGRRFRILVVDDDEGIRYLIKRHLEPEGYEVHTAEDGVDALGQYVGESWDLVLTDRNMPRMSGDALAEAIKRIHPHVPIILVTNYADYASSPLLSESPFDLTLRKPFNGETIRAAVSALCTARRGRVSDC